MSLARSGAHVTSLPSVKAGVAHGVGGGSGGGPGGGRGVVVAPRETAGVGPAVPVVALPALALPAPQAAHLPLLALHPVVAVVVLERWRPQRPTVVLPLRLAQQLLLQNIIVQM